MSKYKVGFVGCGNMGFALSRAVCRETNPENVILACSDKRHAEEKAKKIGASFGTAVEAASLSKFVFLGVKPNMLAAVAGELSGELNARTDEFVIVSMLAGVSIKTLKEYFGAERKIIRIMPNTPAAIGEGMTLMCSSDEVTSTEAAEFKTLMASSGAVDEIAEGLIDAASAISGCGPAFLYMFADALADGGVLCGLKKEKALYYALTMLKGSCALALESGKHPSQLKDEVCSPGGSTIEGVRALVEGGMSSTVMNAVISAFEKTKALGKK